MRPDIVRPLVFLETLPEIMMKRTPEHYTESFNFSKKQIDHLKEEYSLQTHPQGQRLCKDAINRYVRRYQEYSIKSNSQLLADYFESPKPEVSDFEHLVPLKVLIDELLNEHSEIDTHHLLLSPTVKLCKKKHQHLNSIGLAQISPDIDYPFRRYKPIEVMCSDGFGNTIDQESYSLNQHYDYSKERLKQLGYYFDTHGDLLSKNANANPEISDKEASNKNIQSWSFNSELLDQLSDLKIELKNIDQDLCISDPEFARNPSIYIQSGGCYRIQIQKNKPNKSRLIVNLVPLSQNKLDRLSFQEFCNKRNLETKASNTYSKRNSWKIFTFTRDQLDLLIREINWALQLV